MPANTTSDSNLSQAAMHPVSRRSFIRAAGAGAVALPFLLQACGGTAASSPPASALAGASSAGSNAQKVQLPVYIPFQGPKPDFVGSPDGIVPPGYLRYAKSPVKSVTTPPGKGGTVTAMTHTYGAPPTPLAQNAAWQQVNKELNVNLDLPTIPQASFDAKLATVMAGGDLPDLFRLQFLGSTVENEPQFLQSECADLTPYVSGDAIKAYPNLANIPTYCWKDSVFNNRIWMVPAQPGGISGFSSLANFELLEPLGMTSFKDADDFAKAAKDFTIPSKRYMIGGGAIAWFPQVFRVPNDWRLESSGKLTKDYETEEYKAAVAYLRGLWDAGVWYPETPTMSLVQGGDNWDTGKYAIWFGGFTNYQNAWHNALKVDPNFKGHLLVPFPHDGKGQAVQNLGPGAYVNIAMKKASPDRIKELLGVLNYLAAPFGTQEMQLLTYGVKDVDFTFDDKGNPITTKQGTADLTVPWQNVNTHPAVLYDATNPEFVSQTYKEYQAIFALGVQSPVVGLFSETNSTKGATLRTNFTDGINNIMYGRAPMSTYDDLVKAWRSGGGDQIRTEYEQALQAAK